MTPKQPSATGAARTADTAPSRASAGAGQPFYLQLWEDMERLGRVGYWVADLRTGVNEWSAETCRILGLPAGTPATRVEFLSAVHPDDRDGAERAVDSALAERRLAFEHECRIVKPGGEICWVLNRVRAEDGADGPARLVGAFIDVSECRRPQAALVESERRHRLLIEYASDLVMVVDAAGMIEYASPSVERILGYPAGRRLGTSAFALIHPDDEPRLREAMVRRLREDGPPFSVEYRARHADGSWRVLEARAQRRTTPSGTVFLVVNARDITERTQAEAAQQALMRELAAAREAAEAATQAKSAFLANMSHEIRTPMHAIIGITQLLLDTRVSPEQRRHLEIVRDSSDQLLALISDVLDLSKIEAGQLALETIPVDVADLVAGLSTLLGVSARHRGLTVTAVVAPDLPARLATDPTRLRQILTNLIGNAVKFTREGGVTVAVGLEGVVDGRARVRFSVSDTGIGIPSDKLEDIFQAFNQVDVSTTRRYGGTGLGLTICRRLVRAMGGELTVTSTPGAGSEFVFTLDLPVREEARQAGAADPRRRARLAPASRRLAILLAEDNPVNREVAAAMLRKRGHRFVMVPDGRAAVDAASRDRFDIVLMDLHMPHMDGFEATAAIRALPDGDVPIVALTADAMAGERERCLARGMTGYLSKPFRADDLYALVEATARPASSAKPPRAR